MTTKLDHHSQQLLEDYDKAYPMLEQMQREMTSKLKDTLDEAGILVASLESRIKTRKSLAG